MEASQPSKVLTRAVAAGAPLPDLDLCFTRQVHDLFYGLLRVYICSLVLVEVFFIGDWLLLLIAYSLVISYGSFRFDSWH